MPIVADRKLDCIGLFCPMPILKTRDAIKQMDVGQILLVLRRITGGLRLSTTIGTAARQRRHIRRAIAIYRALVAGGVVGPLTWAIWSLVLACVLAAFLVAVRSRPAAAR